MLSQVDHDLLLRLNSFIVYNELFPKILNGIMYNPLIRGFQIFFPFVILWFSDDYDQRRSRMMIGYSPLA
jgi:hypothetical protein